MRDPYDPWADERAQADTTSEIAEARRLDAIRSCTYCDHEGIRPNGLTCRHIDHAAAAARGTANIRQIMGWPDRDETRDEIGGSGTTTPETGQ